MRTTRSTSGTDTKENINTPQMNQWSRKGLAFSSFFLLLFSIGFAFTCRWLAAIVHHFDCRFGNGNVFIFDLQEEDYSIDVRSLSRIGMIGNPTMDHLSEKKHSSPLARPLTSDSITNYYFNYLFIIYPFNLLFMYLYYYLFFLFIFDAYHAFHSDFWQPRFPIRFPSFVSYGLAGPQHIDPSTQVDGVVHLIRIQNLYNIIKQTKSF